MIEYKSLPLKEQAKMLLDAMGSLSVKDQQFAMSLANGVLKFGGLTEKQKPWFDRMMEAALGNKKEAAPPLIKVELGGATLLYEMFATANKKLKYPSITLPVEGGKLELSIAGAGSKYAGQLMVTDGHKYPDNVFYGVISKQGAFSKGYKVSPEAFANAAKLLIEFAANPIEVVIKLGKMSGACCFCGKSLEKENSVAVGFGPVCAANYGLSDQWQAAGGAIKKSVTKQVNAVAKASKVAVDGSPQPTLAFEQESKLITSEEEQALIALLGAAVLAKGQSIVS